MSVYSEPLVIEWNNPDSPDGGLRARWGDAWEGAGRTVFRIGRGWGPGEVAIPSGGNASVAWWPDGAGLVEAGTDSLSGWFESPDTDAPATAWSRFFGNGGGDASGQVREIASAEYMVKPDAGPHVPGLVGSDPGWCRAVDQVVRMAAHELPVLLLGESGVGKEGLAKLVHGAGNRAGESWVPVNCGAIPSGLAESVLFGHRRGAFTGAVSDTPGVFLQADGGTLFLDEVSSLDEAVQAKLLRVLEEGEVRPVGAGESIPVQVRLVCAGQPDLRERVRDGRFRQDLYYRLAYGVVEVPPLRERRGDILPLAEHFLKDLQTLEQRVVRFSGVVQTRLLEHDWPGNVRELRTVVGRMVMLADGDEAGEQHLLLDPLRRQRRGADEDGVIPAMGEGFSLERHLGAVREKLFTEALERSRYNRSAAARMLGVSPQAVSKFVRSCKSQP